MERETLEQSSDRGDDITIGNGLLPELDGSGPASKSSPVLISPTLTGSTAAPSPQRRVPLDNLDSHNSSDGHRMRRNSEPLELSFGGVRKHSASDRSGGLSSSRLVRWAAALTSGKKVRGDEIVEPLSTTAAQRRNPSNSSSTSSGVSSNGGSRRINGDGAPGDDPLDRSAAEDVSVGAALGEGGLFAASPLRHRFRPLRRGSSPWSTSSGRVAVNGGGSERGGVGVAGSSAAVAAAGSSSVLADLIFKSPLTKHVIRRLKMVAAVVALVAASLGALLVGCCLYVTVRPWGRATYRRLLCSQLAAPLVDAASLLLPRTRVRVTGDSDMLDGLCPCVIVSNTLPGNAFLGLDWWAILMVVRAVGAHGYIKVLVSERLNHTPVLGWILRMLEFPGLGDCYQTHRDHVKRSLASFARDSVSAGPSGVPYLFLHFPEGDTLTRDTLASSLEFAHREGRPELTRLLLPHTTALSACLDGLRPAKPVVYDVTLAAAGYSGEVPCGRPPSDYEILQALVTGRAWHGGRATPCAEPSCACRPRPGKINRSGSSEGSGDICGEPTCLCRTTGGNASATPIGFTSGGGTGPVGTTETGDRPVGNAINIGRSASSGGISRNESGDWGHVVGSEAGEGHKWGRGSQDIHVRIKRYSLEEVMGSTHWLDDRWAEKESLLAYFSRHQSFPSDGRGFPARRTLDTRGSQFDGAAMAFVRLVAVLLFVPLLSLAAIPMVVSMGLAALTYRLFSAVLRTVATRILPRGLTRRIWSCPPEEEHEEEDELGQEYSGRQSTLTPWWGGPATPLNTPAPGTAGTMPYIGGGSSHGNSAMSSHDFMST